MPKTATAKLVSTLRRKKLISRPEYVSGVIPTPCTNCRTSRPPLDYRVVLSSGRYSKCIDRNRNECDLIVSKVKYTLAAALTTPLVISRIYVSRYTFFYSLLSVLKSIYLLWACAIKRISDSLGVSLSAYYTLRIFSFRLGFYVVICLMMLKRTAVAIKFY
jgi:hypothetical protein